MWLSDNEYRIARISLRAYIEYLKEKLESYHVGEDVLAANWTEEELVRAEKFLDRLEEGMNGT